MIRIKTLAWQIRFIFHLSLIADRFEPRRFWHLACAWLSDIEYLDVDPEIVAHEEMQTWQEQEDSKRMDLNEKKVKALAVFNENKERLLNNALAVNGVQGKYINFPIKVPGAGSVRARWNIAAQEFDAVLIPIYTNGKPSLLPVKVNQ